MFEIVSVFFVPDCQIEVFIFFRFLMVMEVNILERGTSDGLIICFDMKEVHWGHFIKLGLFTVKHFMFYLQEALPERIKGLHFFNNSAIIDKILALVKPFMKQSLYESLILHPTVESVFTHVPAELFPRDYPGGLEKSMDEIHGKLCVTRESVIIFFCRFR